MITPDLHAEALATFDRLFDEAAVAGEPDRTAMVVATAAPDARPSVRTLLLKDHDARGFVFYTHLDGRKGRELQANPQAALLFHWPRVRSGVQVRIEGMAEIVVESEADAYFASRPRGSQLGAWASRQSETLDSRTTFEQRLAKAESDFAGHEVPRPPRWSGTAFTRSGIRFQSRPQRLCEKWSIRCSIGDRPRCRDRALTGQVVRAGTLQELAQRLYALGIDEHDIHLASPDDGDHAMSLSQQAEFRDAWLWVAATSGGV